MINENKREELRDEGKVDSFMAKIFIEIREEEKRRSWRMDINDGMNEKPDGRTKKSQEMKEYCRVKSEWHEENTKRISWLMMNRHYNWVNGE